MPWCTFGFFLETYLCVIITTSSEHIIIRDDIIVSFEDINQLSARVSDDCSLLLSQVVKILTGNQTPQFFFFLLSVFMGFGANINHLCR